MDSRRTWPVVFGTVVVFLVLGTTGAAVASPAPVAGCPPCGDGFVYGAQGHDLDTEVQHSEATVRVHENSSATWTVQVVPTNESVLDRLAENRSLARAVAADSYGTRYGGDIEHELVGVNVDDDAFVMRYRTHNVVRDGPFGTRTLTYFRDSPGAYVYTDLGADELTVVAPQGMTVARGFGTVTGDRMTATELPGVRDGPFVVFVPEGSPAPGLMGTLAIASSLWDVVVRNLAFFVALPGGALVGGFAAIRRFFDSERSWDPARLGGIVAAGGTVLLVGALFQEGDALPAVTGNLLLGGFVGTVLVALGGSVAVPRIRRHLTGLRIVGAGVALGVVALIVTGTPVGTSGFHGSLSLMAAFLPIAVGMGWIDATDLTAARSLSTRVFVGFAVAVAGALVASAPLTALGGSLFLLVPILLTVAAVAVVVGAIPLYLLGAAGANAERT